MVAPLAHLACLLALAANPRPLSQVVADLGSTDYARREEATVELTLPKSFTLAELEAALKDPSLSAEQRLRLDEAAFRHFADSPRGALGVNFNTNVRTAEVSSVLEKFPASAVLKPGDVITQIDGVPVTSRVSADGGWSTVRALIISHDPGDNVPVIVQRKGDEVPLTVKLGEFGGLGPSSAIYSYEMRAAWEHRLARSTGLTPPQPIDATSLRNKRDNAWSNAGTVDVVDAVTASRAMAGEVPSVAAGASPDQARQLDRADQAMFGGRQEGAGFARAFGNNGFVFGGGRAMALGNDQRDLGRMTDRDLADERMRLTQWLQSFAMIAAQQERAQRRQFTDLQNQTLSQLNAVTREIEKRKAARLDAALDPAPAQPDKEPDQKLQRP